MHKLMRGKNECPAAVVGRLRLDGYLSTLRLQMAASLPLMLDCLAVRLAAAGLRTMHNLSVAR